MMKPGRSGKLHVLSIRFHGAYGLPAAVYLDIYILLLPVFKQMFEMLLYFVLPPLFPLIQT